MGTTGDLAKTIGEFKKIRADHMLAGLPGNVLISLRSILSQTRGTAGFDYFNEDHYSNMFSSIKTADGGSSSDRSKILATDPNP